VQQNVNQPLKILLVSLFKFIYRFKFIDSLRSLSKQREVIKKLLPDFRGRNGAKIILEFRLKVNASAFVHICICHSALLINSSNMMSQMRPKESIDN